MAQYTSQKGIMQMVKRIMQILLAGSIAFSLSACQNTAASETKPLTGSAAERVQSSQALSMETSGEDASTGTETGAAAETPSQEHGRALVAYFSWSGNTREMASYIAEQTNADMFEIRPVVPYPDDYQKTGDIAKEERDSNARPEIQDLPENISEYDTLFIGYPIWWHTAPMIIGTFLEQYDLTGIEIYPFTQSGSMDEEQFHNSMNFIRESAKGARVHDGLFVEASDTDGIRAYLTENGYQNTAGGAASQTGNSNILIAYFSVMETDGVDTVGGASRVAVDGEVMGNNEYVAKLIQQETGGDLFSIETVQDYPTTHEPLLEFAYREKTENARPELAAQIENLDQYDTIFLGYPNWNSDLPMPLYTFLESYDFSGKTVIPFTTHGGSGFSRTIRTIESLQPNAKILKDGLSISRNSVSGSKNQVSQWVQGLGLAK